MEVFVKAVGQFIKYPGPFIKQFINAFIQLHNMKKC